MFWFAGRTGPQAGMCSQKRRFEVPSDFAGVVYTDMDERGAWKGELLKELEVRGLRSRLAKSNGLMSIASIRSSWKETDMADDVFSEALEMLHRLSDEFGRFADGPQFQLAMQQMQQELVELQIQNQQGHGDRRPRKSGDNAESFVRIVAAAAQRKMKDPADYSTPAFQCLDDYTKCLGRHRSVECKAFLVICVARTMIPGMK